MDGFVGKFQNAAIAFNFDDLILLPGLARAEPKDVKLTTKFSKNIGMRIPLVSSPMDTVTETEMAVAIARRGGIGVIHRNCSADEELAMVEAVKKAEPDPKYKDAVKDKKGRLVVAAAVSPFDLDRAKRLSKHADALVVDVAHFHNVNVMEATKKIIKESGVDIIVGNLGTKEGVSEVVTKLDGIAGLRVGIGSGSICITTDVTKAGSPTLFAVAQAADALDEIGSDIPIIADGGIRTAGDIALAMAFGASSAMLGRVFSGCKESPSQMTMVDNKYYKIHRGMGSRAARERRAIADRYADTGGKNIAEGIEMQVPYSGELDNVVDELTSGIRAAMGYAGATDVKEMGKYAKVARANIKSKI